MFAHNKNNNSALPHFSELRAAAKSGDLRAVRHLVEVRHADIEARGIYPGDQETALSIAARAGHNHVVKYLLANGADANGKISYGTTLGCAIDSGKLEVVQTLIAAGTIITPEDLHYAIASGILEIVDFLVQNGANVHEPYLEPFIRVAAGSGNLALLQYLEKLGLHVLDGNKYHSWEDPEKEILKHAIGSCSADMMRYLVEVHKLDIAKYVNKENSGELCYKYNADSSMLGKAISKGFDRSQYKSNQVLLLQYLLHDLNLAPSKVGMQRLMHEAQFVSIPVRCYLESYLAENDREFLLGIAKHGVDSLDIKGLFKLYTFNFSDTYDREHHIAELIKARNISKEEFGRLCLADKAFAIDVLFYFSSWSHKDVNMLKYLVELGVDINHPNSAGDYLLSHVFAHDDDYDLARYLISKGADVDQCDTHGWTIMNVAGSRLGRDDAFVDELLTHSKDFTNALVKASKAQHDITLSKILALTHGEIGRASAAELVENAGKCHNLYALLGQVSQHVFDEMVPLVKDKQFMEKHYLKQEDVDKMLATARQYDYSQDPARKVLRDAVSLLGFYGLTARTAESGKPIGPIKRTVGMSVF